MRKAVGPLLLLGVLVIIVGIVIARQFGGSGSGAPAQKPIIVDGKIGSEKTGLLNDAAIQRLLADRYHLAVSFATEGSISIAQGADQGQDFLWPASEYAREIFVARHGPPAKDEVIFNSPIVMYSWRPITRALEAHGIVRRQGAAYYIVDLPKLIHLELHGRTWQSIGVPASIVTGPILIQTTDPTQSNSGFMFAGLLANILNHGQLVDETSVKRVLPRIRQFFGAQGLMQPSTGTLFDDAISTGVGSVPLWIGYENLYIEEAITHPQYRQALRRDVNILYPRPTEISTHDFLALDAKGVRLLRALEDPELQQLAWTRHGFRSGLVGVQNSPSVLVVAGVPKTIVQTMPLPRPAVMSRILHALSQ
jgi:hypothetical protein